MRALRAVGTAIMGAGLVAGCGGGDGAGGEDERKRATAQPTERAPVLAERAVKQMTRFRDARYRGTVRFDMDDGKPGRAQADWLITGRTDCQVTVRNRQNGEMTLRRVGRDMYFTADDRGWVGWLGYDEADVSWLRGGWIGQRLKTEYSVVGCEASMLFNDFGAGWGYDAEPRLTEIDGVPVQELSGGLSMGVRKRMYVAQRGKPRIVRVAGTGANDDRLLPLRVDLVATNRGAKVERPPASALLP